MAGSEKEQPRPVEQENEPGPLTSSLRKSSMSTKKKGVNASQTGKGGKKKSSLDLLTLPSSPHRNCPGIQAHLIFSH